MQLNGSAILEPNAPINGAGVRNNEVAAPLAGWAFLEVATLEMDRSYCFALPPTELL